MLIKLNFTALKSQAQLFRVLAQIINNETITSVSGLTQTATSEAWAADLLSSFVADTSFIYRSNNISTSKTKAHISRPAASSGLYAFSMVLQQEIYDSPGNYFYTRFYNTTTTTNSSIGSSSPTLAGGTMESSQWPITSNTSLTTSQGTQLTCDSVFTVNPLKLATPVAGGSYCAWFYVTDTAFLTFFNNVSYTALGLPTLDSYYSGQTSGSTGFGPHFIGQYERYDYWNSHSNGIYPFMWDRNGTSSGATAGFGGLAELIGLQNPNSATLSEGSFQVYNAIITGGPGTATSWVIQTGSRAALMLGSRSSDIAGLTSVSGNSSSSTVTVAYGAVISTTAQSRAVSADLIRRGYLLLPILWTNTNKSFVGGNFTSLSGVYFFNGDYFPGDELIVDNKTYVLIPTGYGWTTRTALAIPKE